MRTHPQLTPSRNVCESDTEGNFQLLIFPYGSHPWPPTATPGGQPPAHRLQNSEAFVSSPFGSGTPMVLLESEGAEGRKDGGAPLVQRGPTRGRDNGWGFSALFSSGPGSRPGQPCVLGHQTLPLAAASVRWDESPVQSGAGSSQSRALARGVPGGLVLLLVPCKCSDTCGRCPRGDWHPATPPPERDPQAPSGSGSRICLKLSDEPLFYK